MAAIVTVTFVDGYTLSAAQLNQIQTNVKAVVDGDIENSNIKALAGIVESKLLFSDAGHDHTGGADGKKIDINSLIGDLATITVPTNEFPPGKLPAAVENAAHGLLKYKTDDPTVGSGCTEVVNFAGDAFTAPPIVRLYTYDGYGSLIFYDGDVGMFLLADFSGMILSNMGHSDIDIVWIAIGI